MSRPPSPSLTDGELRIMRALWDLGPATVAEVRCAMGRQGGDPPSYNSVLTILGILERKRYVGHKKDGRAYLFHPIVPRAAARKNALAQLLAKFFDGSASALALDLFGHHPVDAQELARIREWLDRRDPPARKRRR